eukprot:m.6480 g.6480  ORF g.6480 m.6480 type:complete len:100 (+) comp2605_c0_seq2:111-410(+)
MSQQKQVISCSSCGAYWADGSCTEGCEECGGYGMRRPCPICNGTCGMIWVREIEMSWSHHSAFWDGQCSLPQEQQMHLLMRQSEATFDDLIDGLEDVMK